MSGIPSPLKKSVAAHDFCSFSKLQIYSSLPKITVLIFSIDWFQEFSLFKKKKYQEYFWQLFSRSLQETYLFTFGTLKAQAHVALKM